MSAVRPGQWKVDHDVSQYWNSVQMVYKAGNSLYFTWMIYIMLCVFQGQADKRPETKRAYKTSRV